MLELFVARCLATASPLVFDLFVTACRELACAVFFELGIHRENPSGSAAGRALERAIFDESGDACGGCMVEFQRQNMEKEIKAGVFEVKFLLPPARITPVLEWIREHLQPDPHGGGDLRDAYLVQSIYLDTPSFDVYHRRNSFARAKFRIRRYGEDPWIFLERKLKRSGVVRKRRSPIPPAELAHLRAEKDGVSWPGAWFHHRLLLRRLRPVIRMSYDRVARLGSAMEGPFRVTLDRNVRAEPVNDLESPCVINGADLLQGSAILEVKFNESLPAVVRQLVEQTGISAGAISKYRLGVRACGLVPGTPGRDGTPSVSAPVHV